MMQLVAMHGPRHHMTRLNASIAFLSALCFPPMFQGIAALYMICSPHCRNLSAHFRDGIQSRRSGMFELSFKTYSKLNSAGKAPERTSFVACSSQHHMHSIFQLHDRVLVSDAPYTRLLQVP